MRSPVNELGFFCHVLISQAAKWWKFCSRRCLRAWFPWPNPWAVGGEVFNWSSEFCWKNFYVSFFFYPFPFSTHPSRGLTAPIPCQERQISGQNKVILNSIPDPAFPMHEANLCLTLCQTSLLKCFSFCLPSPVPCNIVGEKKPLFFFVIFSR